MARGRLAGLSAPWDADLTASTRAVALRVGATGTFSVAILAVADLEDAATGSTRAAAATGIFPVAALGATGLAAGRDAASSNVIVVEPTVILSPEERSCDLIWTPLT